MRTWPPDTAHARRPAPCFLSSSCRSYSSTQSCRPGEGLYNLRGDERRWHFAALFEAADVSGDGRLDVVELRHLLNPHLSQNHALQLMALNMTIVNELCAPCIGFRSVHG